jgi:propanol-preferring alcohol dehydrogenase
LREDRRGIVARRIDVRAWTIEQPRPVAEVPLGLRELPDPSPGPGEVRLRVRACGVCRTDVHVAEGDLPLRAGPVVPGHQIVGTIDALGEGVETPRVGETVGVTWLAGACGTCAWCADGRENLCPTATFTGWDRNGGYAEMVVARADVTVPLPDGLPPAEAAPLLCAGIIGWRALRLAGMRAGQRIGLVGFGASAHLALQAARKSDCEVVVFTRGGSHRERALAMGATRAGGLEDGEPTGCHGIVTFAPVGSVVPAALRHLRPGGTLAINAVHMTDIPSFPYERLFGERVVRSVSNLTRADARDYLGFAAREGVRARVTTYPFERANEALQDVEASRLDGQAVLEIRP